MESRRAAAAQRGDLPERVHTGVGPGGAVHREPLADKRLPAGPCVLRAIIVADVMPLNFNKNGRAQNMLDSNQPWLSTAWIVNSPSGGL